MITTTDMLLEQYKQFGDPFGKIRRLCKEGKLFPITRGLYETDGNAQGKWLSGAIFGPSYLSFDYALAQYGLIPEAVYEYTSATCQKGKKKNYSNHFGDFSYRDIPEGAFPFGTRLMEENGYFYYMASPEKALCDKIYDVKAVANLEDMKNLLFEDLRLEEDAVKKLDADAIAELSKLYHSNSVKLLAKYLYRCNHE